jgi:hypothetical protein
MEVTKVVEINNNVSDFFVVLVSRSSSYKPIPEKVFENFRKTLAENEK